MCKTRTCIWWWEGWPRAIITFVMSNLHALWIDFEFTRKVGLYESHFPSRVVFLGQLCFPQTELFPKLQFLHHNLLHESWHFFINFEICIMLNVILYCHVTVYVMSVSVNPISPPQGSVPGPAVFCTDWALPTPSASCTDYREEGSEGRAAKVTTFL